jgi:hypothetical protein
VALRLRNAHSLNRQRLALAAVLVALVPVATEIPSIASLAGVTTLLWAMIAYETTTYGESRARLRLGGEP